MSKISDFKARRARIRQHIRTMRKELSSEEIAAASQSIRQQLLTHPFLRQPRNIASYMSFAGEIDTVHLNQMLQEAHHNICLPVISLEQRGMMDFYLYHDISELVPNRYSILEPVSSPETHIPPDHLEVVLVPLVAFNSRGDRLGMGGGYYDRLLKKISCSCLTLGLAYDFQLSEEIESQQWDMPLDEVITPTRHYHFTNKY